LTARGHTAERNTKAAQERESLRRAASMSVLVPRKSAALNPKKEAVFSEKNRQGVGCRL